MSQLSMPQISTARASLRTSALREQRTKLTISWINGPGLLAASTLRRDESVNRTAVHSGNTFTSVN